MFPPTSSVRKFVLEATNRALKDLPSSDSPETHYSRLLALSNLCHSLLTVRFNVNGKQVGGDPNTQCKGHAGDTLPGYIDERSL